MSKAFALAGGRIGYLAADPAVVDAVQLVRLPYHLSALTQAVARAALAHTEALLSTVDAIKAQRDRIVTTLRRWGLTVADSDANFVLFQTRDDSKATWQALLDRGVLVRDVGLAGLAAGHRRHPRRDRRLPGRTRGVCYDPHGARSSG